MRITRGRRLLATARVISTPTIIPTISCRKIIWAQTSGISSRRNKAGKRKSKSAWNNGEHSFLNRNSEVQNPTSGNAPHTIQSETIIIQLVRLAALSPSLVVEALRHVDAAPYREQIMPAKIRDSKAALRTQIRAHLEKMPAAERATASTEICLRLKDQEIWKSARSILFYAPLPEEPDIWPLLDDAFALGKTVALPRFAAEQKRYAACRIQNTHVDLQSGRFGIREPTNLCAKISLNELDLILVPGIAFDLNGHRLGRGKGFYDHLLALVRGLTCGVAFDQQIVSEIPIEPHDVRLSCILTPTRWCWFASPRAVLE